MTMKNPALMLRMLQIIPNQNAMKVHHLYFQNRIVMKLDETVWINGTDTFGSLRFLAVTSGHPVDTLTQ